MALPDGAKRTVHKGWEEVYVPPVIPPPVEPTDLVPITDLDEFAQLAFRGTQRLNRIQSKVREK